MTNLLKYARESLISSLIAVVCDHQYPDLIGQHAIKHSIYLHVTQCSSGACRRQRGLSWSELMQT